MLFELSRLTRVLGGLGVVAGLTLGASAANAADVTLRLHHFLPPQANVPKLVLQKWSDDVGKASNKQIKVRIYPGMQLGGKPPELMDQAKDGIADVIWTVVGYTPGRFPRTEVFELPFMMTDSEATSRAFWDLYKQEMETTEFKDLKILGTWVHGPGLIHSSKPVTLPADLAGVKIRGGSRVVNQLLEKLGATPVGMPVPAVAEGLSKGVIDATTIPWEVTRALKVPELVKNHTEFGNDALYTLTFVLAMNKAKYESMSPEQKKAIDDSSGMEFSAFAGRTQGAADAPARADAEKLGNNIITLDEAQVEQWRKASMPIYDEWIANMKTQDIDGKALIEKAQGLIQKYTK